MIFSYSFIDQFENCPKAAHDRYVLRTKRGEKESAIPGIEEHEAIAKRISHKIPLPEAYTRAENLVQPLEARGQLEAEVKLGVTREMEACDFFAGIVFLRGVIDVLMRRNGTAFIGDWKTGKVYEKELQLLIFALLVFENFENIDAIAAVNLWLKTGRPGAAQQFIRADLPQMRAEVYGHIRRLEEADEKDDWPEKPGPLCAWCQVVECKFNPRREK